MLKSWKYNRHKIAIKSDQIGFFTGLSLENFILFVFFTFQLFFSALPNVDRRFLKLIGELIGKGCTPYYISFSHNIRISPGDDIRNIFFYLFLMIMMMTLTCTHTHRQKNVLFFRFRKQLFSTFFWSLNSKYPFFSGSKYLVFVLVIIPFMLSCPESERQRKSNGTAFRKKRR